MQHMVNKARACWVAAILISGHLAHTGNHRYGTAGHSQGRCSPPKAVVCAKRMALCQEAVVTGGYRSCPAMQCGATVTRALTHLHRPVCKRALTAPGRLEDLEA